MKKQILLGFIFILLNPILALDFRDLSFNQALKLAKKENKFLFLMVEEEYCPWCRKIKNTTLKDEEVMEILGSNYISIKLYKNSSGLKRKFYTRFVPTIFLINPKKEKETSKILGYISAQSLYDKLFIFSRW